MRHGLVILAIPVCVMAQSAPSEFPANAKPISAEEVKARLADQVYWYKGADGGTGRVEFKGEYVYSQYGAGRASGTWSVGDSSVCFKMSLTAGSGCSAARTVDDVLYLKRVSNGEVVRLEKR